MSKSDKLHRLVQFDSDLELLVLRQLDADPRVVEYQEQPVMIPISRFEVVASIGRLRVSGSWAGCCGWRCICSR